MRMFKVSMSKFDGFVYKLSCYYNNNNNDNDNNNNNKLYSNEDSTMRLVRAFEENAAHQGHQSLVKEARMFAEELGFTLVLSFPHPKCRDNTDGADVPRDKIKRHLKKAAMEQWKTEVKEKRWQGKLSKMGGGPAEPAGMLCVAEELGYGAFTHHRGDA